MPLPQTSQLHYRSSLTSNDQAYLSKAHVAGVETGCAISALCSEMPRQSPEVRHAATLRIKEMIDLVARQMPDWGQPSAHERAMVTVATMVGTLTLARAVDEALSEAMCSATLNSLSNKTLKIEADFFTSNMMSIIRKISNINKHDNYYLIQVFKKGKTMKAFTVDRYGKKTRDADICQSLNYVMTRY